jgi:hypothetical protein
VQHYLLYRLNTPDVNRRQAEDLYAFQFYFPLSAIEVIQSSQVALCIRVVRFASPFFIFL